jgi:ADP-ribose pyrophosphatase
MENGVPRKVWECPWWYVEERRFEFRGKPQTWYSVQRTVAETVHILGVTAEGQVPVLRQWRVPLQDWVWELPAGICDVPGEPEEQTAQRELLEETGYACDRIDLLVRSTVSPGLTGELWLAYLAQGLRKEEDGGGVHGEQMELHHVAFSDLDDWLLARALAGELIDAKVLAHTALARRFLAA